MDIALAVSITVNIFQLITFCFMVFLWYCSFKADADNHLKADTEKNYELEHYRKIRKVVHEWSCDYALMNPDKKPKHTKEEYFDMILNTFENKENE